MGVREADLDAVGGGGRVLSVVVIATGLRAQDANRLIFDRRTRGSGYQAGGCGLWLIPLSPVTIVAAVG